MTLTVDHLYFLRDLVDAHRRTLGGPGSGHHGHSGRKGGGSTSSGPPSWWGDKSTSRLDGGMTRGEVIVDWLTRNKVPKVGDKYRMYHATPKGNAFTELKVGSYLAQDPETAIQQAGRDRGLKAGKIQVHEVLFYPWEVSPTSVWAITTVPITLEPTTLGGPGSGNFGHAGRPGKVGGSTSAGSDYTYAHFTAYHGTSDQAWQSIQREGLIPKKGIGADILAGIPEFVTDVGVRPQSVFITKNLGTATTFADFVAGKTNTDPVVLKVTIPDEVAVSNFLDEKIVPDEVAGETMLAWQYVGKIPPEWIERVDYRGKNKGLFGHMHGDDYKPRPVGSRFPRPREEQLADVVYGRNLRAKTIVYVVIPCDGLKTAGGPGSGNFGHAGRPGQVGGSASSYSFSHMQLTDDEDEYVHAPGLYISPKYGPSEDFQKTWRGPKAADDVRVGLPFSSQVDQYPEKGKPGVDYFKGEIDDERYVDALLYRDPKGKVVGILNHYPMDFTTDGPMGMTMLLESKGNINIMVDPTARGQGVATALLTEAGRRWPINLYTQDYSAEGRKFVTQFLKKNTVRNEMRSRPPSFKGLGGPGSGHYGHTGRKGGGSTSGSGLSGLAAEARKAGSFEEFERDFLRQIKHGTYWHVTTDPDFSIDPAKGPKDMSSMADGQMTAGALMVTSDLELWAENYEGLRAHVAQIDMSEVPRNAYYQVKRGFGNEFYVTEPAKAKVVGVFPVAKALKINEELHRQLPQSTEELRAFYDKVTLKGLGGPGSGNFGHAGRPGKVGGSATEDTRGAGHAYFSLREYLQNTHTFINGYLRNHRFLKKGTFAYDDSVSMIDGLDYAFQDPKIYKVLKKDTVVHRGIESDATRRAFNRMRAGSVFGDKAFLSTSQSETIAEKAMDGGKGSVMLSIELPKGVRYLTGRQDEREYLLNRGIKMKIVSIDKDEYDPVLRVRAKLIPGEYK